MPVAASSLTVWDSSISLQEEKEEEKGGRTRGGEGRRRRSRLSLYGEIGMGGEWGEGGKPECTEKSPYNLFQNQHRTLG